VPLLEGRRRIRFAHLPIPQDAGPVYQFPGVCSGGIVLGSSPIRRSLSPRSAISGPSTLSAAGPPHMVEKEEMNHHGSPGAETKKSHG
jgi:hypothetical protein